MKLSLDLLKHAAKDAGNFVNLGEKYGVFSPYEELIVFSERAFGIRATWDRIYDVIIESADSNTQELLIECHGYFEDKATERYRKDNLFKIIRNTDDGIVAISATTTLFDHFDVKPYKETYMHLHASMGKDNKIGRDHVARMIVVEDARRVLGQDGASMTLNFPHHGTVDKTCVGLKDVIENRDISWHGKENVKNVLEFVHTHEFTPSELKTAAGKMLENGVIRA